MGTVLDIFCASLEEMILQSVLENAETSYLRSWWITIYAREGVICGHYFTAYSQVRIHIRINAEGLLDQ